MVGRCGEPLDCLGSWLPSRRSTAQETFVPGRFRELSGLTPVVGEIGLDTGCRTPWDLQLRTFRAALSALADLPRTVSIHAFPEPRPVLDELRRTPVSTPVLHGWRGTAAETREAVAMGCYFTVHSQVARWSIFRSWVPPERVLLETDHDYGDPPAAIPCRIQWVEHLVAQQYEITVQEVRRLVWQNLGALARETGTLGLLPEGIRAFAVGQAGPGRGGRGQQRDESRES